MDISNKPDANNICRQRAERAALLATTQNISTAIQTGLLPQYTGLTLSEALVLGLLKQDVRIFYAVLGHGSTEVSEVLRIYQEAGLLKVFGVHSEIEASHAAVALRWVTGEKAAVITSIGPGALQALAASIVPASDGIGVWYLMGDETSEDEGFNMQQIPKHEQGLFEELASKLGTAYSMHTPLALPTALRRGTTTVDHPYRPGPFYLLLPMNTQAAWMPNFNLCELPEAIDVQIGAAQGDYELAAEWIRQAEKVLVKVGGGGRNARLNLVDLLERSGGVLVHTPIASGCISYKDNHNLGVGGSKGSLCGNYAMENADLLIAIGTRAVCQSDCSRTGYPNVMRVININADIEDAVHYQNTLALVGDTRLTLEKLNAALGNRQAKKTSWLGACHKKKLEWQALKLERFNKPILYDEYWGRKVLTQPAVIMTALQWAKENHAVSFFDAGDVQANGFQIAEDDDPSLTFTEAGASYMGFAVSALLATAVSQKPFYGIAFSGDGSFVMNPQILIDGAEYGAKGCILLFDNGRMGAITGLQEAQYGNSFATWNTIKIDYVAWARSIPGVQALYGGDDPHALHKALDQAIHHTGLTLIHIPVYFGPDPLGGMGVYGRWNVGNWCDEVQALRHKIGL